MKKGDVVLLPVPFTDLSGNKNRPAVVLISSADDVTVCFLTSQLKWQTEFDLIIQPTNYNGLKLVSLIKLNKIASIDRDLIIGRLGTLDNDTIDLLNKKLIYILKLNI